MTTADGEAFEGQVRVKKKKNTNTVETSKGTHYAYRSRILVGFFFGKKNRNVEIVYLSVHVSFLLRQFHPPDRVRFTNF